MLYFILFSKASLQSSHSRAFQKKLWTFVPLYTRRLLLTHSLRQDVCIMPMLPAHLHGHISLSGDPSTSGVPSSSVPKQILHTCCSLFSPVGYSFELDYSFSYYELRLCSSLISPSLLKLKGILLNSSTSSIYCTLLLVSSTELLLTLIKLLSMLPRAVVFLAYRFTSGLKFVYWVAYLFKLLG